MTRRPSLPMRRLQALDRRLGPTLCALVAPSRLAGRAWRAARAWLDRRRGLLRPNRPAQRVLLVKFWGLGSLQLLTPAARALRQRHPAASLELLTLAPNADFARRLGLVDVVHTLDVQGAGALRVMGRLARTAARLARRRYDVVVDFEFLTCTSALVGALVFPRRLVGFTSPRAWRGGLHDETLHFDEDRHVAACFRDLAAGEVLGDVHPDDVTPPRVTAAEAAAVHEFLKERLAGSRRPLAVLNPNVGELAPERRWPSERFGGLARALVADGFDVALIGAAGEVDVCAAVRHAALAPTGVAGDLAELDARILDVSGGFSLGELCALLARADLVVSNDSGPMHLGAALGAPTLGLFGPETPKRYAPLGPRAVALWDAPPCGPCINVHDNKLADCVFGRAECMLRLSLERVHTVALALARRARAGQSAGAGPVAGMGATAAAERERAL